MSRKPLIGVGLVYFKDSQSIKPHPFDYIVDMMFKTILTATKKFGHNKKKSTGSSFRKMSVLKGTFPLGNLKDDITIIFNQTPGKI